MKVLFFLIWWAVFRFVNGVGWQVFGGLFGYFLVELIFSAIRDKTEFHFIRAILILGGLLLILLITNKLTYCIVKRI